MLSYLQQGQLPGVNEEGATGKLENKGAIFILKQIRPEADRTGFGGTQ